MRREPTYSVTIVGTLALGVAGVIAVSSLASAVLGPLPFPDPGALYAVWETRDGARRSVAPANYLDWRRESRTFTGLAAYTTRSVSITVRASASREQVAVVSGNFFDVLGMQPRIGRGFDGGFDPVFAERVVVLTDDARNRSFGPGVDVVGRTIMVDDRSYLVIGVMAPGFAFPSSSLYGWIRSPTEAPDIRGFEGDIAAMRDAWYFRVIGRLAPDRTVVDARAEMASLADRLAALFPETNEGSGVELVPLLEQTVAGFEATLVALGLAVVLVLMGSVFNVLHLTLAHGESRRTDFAVRRALGASSGDIRRGALAEGWVLGVIAAALGIALARWALALAVADLGDAIPRAAEVGLSPSLVAVGTLLGLAVGTLVATATLPRGHARISERSTPPSTAGGRRLVGVQVAISIGVLTGSILLAGSLIRLSAVDLGFETSGLTTLRLAMPDAPSHPYPERVARYRAVADAVRRLPGVEAVGLGSDAPVEMGTQAGVFMAGEERATDPPNAGWQPVDDGYFGALGMELVRGRLFTVTDGPDDRSVAVVNEAFVRSVLRGSDPLGARVTMGLDGHDRPLTIVGVVADTRTRGPSLPAGPVLYRPIDQATGFRANSIFLAVRWSDEAREAAATVRSTLRAIAPELPLYAEAAGDDLVRPFHRSRALLLTIMATFAATALAIGFVGVYGVGMHTVRRRRREIGVRLALGATSQRITREVVGRGMRWAALGVPPGLLLALLVGRSMSGLLFEVGAADARTLVGVTVAVLLLTAAALYGPARLAATTDAATATKEG
jgi:predicted permease